jgi:hypothetical protein
MEFSLICVFINLGTRISNKNVVYIKSVEEHAQKMLELCIPEAVIVSSIYFPEH